MGRETVRVGVTWSNSGWCWLDSRLLYTALQVWVRQTNDAGGVFVPEEGRHVPVELLMRDDRSDPETAVAAVKELIGLGVDVFCSSGSAEIQAEVVPITEAAGVLNLNVGAPDSALFEGSRFHLQCGSSVHTYMASRPSFWKRHGLLRLAQIHAELPGWTATHGPMRDYAAAEGGFDVVLYESVPRQQRWTTAYGPYPADFDVWDDLVDRLVRAQPDVVVLGLPAPAEYQIVRAMRRRGVWFRYLEMLYGQFMGRVGLGPEDLLYQFHPGWTPDVDPATINVGGTPADLAAATARYFPGVEGHPVPRSYVGLAVWAHLVANAGSLAPERVMAQAHAESGSLVTMEGRLTWAPDGDTIPPEHSWAGIYQVRRHPWTAELSSVLVHPGDDAEAEPVFTDVPYERRPPPWSGTW